MPSGTIASMMARAQRIAQGRAIEDRLEAVARGADLPTTETSQLRARNGIVRIQQLTPAVVTEGGPRRSVEPQYR